MHLLEFTKNGKNVSCHLQLQNENVHYNYLLICYTSEGEYYVIRTIYAIFSDWAETFFLGFSDLRNNEITNDLYVCDSIILWPFQLCHHFYI